MDRLIERVSALFAVKEREEVSRRNGTREMKFLTMMTEGQVSTNSPGGTNQKKTL
jgi:hypothetical protein